MIREDWCDDVKFPKRCRPLPPGYRIALLDSGHYLWTFEDFYEGVISWDRWWVRRCAFHHHAEQVAIGLVVAVLRAVRGAL